jgi:hypothetical protein
MCFKQKLCLPSPFGQITQPECPPYLYLYFLEWHVVDHKVLIYLEYYSVPSSELGPPHPLSRKQVYSVLPPPAKQRGGGHTRLRVRGWGSPTSDD